MTYAGARGNTEKEMASTLRFSLTNENLHPAFSAIESKLSELTTWARVRPHERSSTNGWKARHRRRSRTLFYLEFSMS